MTTASNTVRNEVNTLRINEGSTTPAQKTNTSPNTPSKSTSLNLDIIRAATAVYRSQNAPKDKPYNVTDKQKATFEAAQKQLAEKKGIIPDEDGKYRPEHEKELSPLEVIKQFSFEHYKEKKDNDEASKDIGDIFSEVYNDEKDGQKEPVPEQLKSLNASLSNKTFYTDIDFLALPPEKQQEYLESIKEYGAEYDRLTELLNKSNLPNNNDHKSMDLENEKDDVDGPRSGEKDYSTKQKDIIEWMMEEIILKGLDWVGNRIIDYTTGTAYGYIYRAHQNFKRRRKERKEEKQRAEALSKSKSASNPSNPNPNTNPPSPNEEKYDFITSCIRTYRDVSVPAFEKELTEGVHNFHKLLRKGISHDVIIEEDGFIDEVKKHPYSKRLIQAFKDKQSQFDSEILANLAESLGLKDEKDIEALKQWQNEINSNNERRVKKEQETEVQIPETLQKKGLTTEHLTKKLTEIIEKTRDNATFMEIKSEMETSATLFGIHYSIYKIIEDMRAAKTDEEKAKLKDPEYGRNLERTYFNEGKMIMYQDIANLHNGDENATSIEEMIELSKNMAETSISLYEQNDTTTKSKNLIEEKISPTTDPEKKQSIVEFSKGLKKFDDYIKTEHNNLKILQKEEDSHIASGEKNKKEKRCLEERRNQTGINKRYEKINRFIKTNND